MSTVTRSRTERRKQERVVLKEQRKGRATALPPITLPAKAGRCFPVTFVAILVFIATGAVALASFLVRTPSKQTPPAVPLQTASNQTVIRLDDGSLAYATDNRITAVSGSDARHRQLLGLQYTVGSVDDTDYHPLLWRSAEMSLQKPDGSVAEVSASRPLWWFELTKAREGATVPLDIREAGISGLATVHKVTSLSDRPYVPPSPDYHPIIGTIKHLNASVLALTFEGAEDQPLGVTPNHPLWSEDRQDWVPAGELRIGERVATADEAAPARLLRSEPQPGRPTVYNIEVHRSHSYHVGKLGLAAHNTGLDCDRIFSVYYKLRAEGNSPSEAFTFLGRRLPNVSSMAIGKSLGEALKDVGIPGNFWTKDKFFSESQGAGMNAYFHYTEHVV